MLLPGILMGMVSPVYQVNIQSVGLWVGPAVSATDALKAAVAYFGIAISSPTNSVTQLVSSGAFGGRHPGTIHPRAMQP